MLNSYQTETNLCKLSLNIHGFRLRIITYEDVIREMEKYYKRFMDDYTFAELTYYFILDKVDKRSEELKKLPGFNEKWKDLFIYEEGKDKKYFIIPDKGYPVVLINQIINNLTSDMLSTHGIIPFHAAAVSKDDKALLLMGEHMSGKTTLSLSLTLCGYQYFTDDIALVNLETNEVLPYFAGITPRLNTVKMFPEIINNEYAHPYIDFDDDEQRWCIELNQVFVEKLSQACKLKYIIFPKFKPEGNFMVKPMNKSAAIVTMLKNMKMIPTLIWGSRIVQIMSQILSREVTIFYMEYPKREDALNFINSIYEE